MSRLVDIPVYQFQLVSLPRIDAPLEACHRAGLTPGGFHVADGVIHPNLNPHVALGDTLTAAPRTTSMGFPSSKREQPALSTVGGATRRRIVRRSLILGAMMALATFAVPA